MTTYQRLGDYIREVNVRNKDLKVTKLVGLTIGKAFIPSVANVIGTDLSNYKVIQKEQFACSLMQVSRDGRMPVAMFEEDGAIMSPAYPMFEVIDKTALLPQYLMMWFSRSEFDREASYYAVGGVRGSLTWEDFCNMTLPVPSIDRQREIVEEYETLSRRIRLNEQMIEKLEATAQALYRKILNCSEKTIMHKLGDVIKEVNKRNKLLEITRTMGVTVNKIFIPTYANISYTDLSNYKIITYGQFACSLIQVSRDGKMPISLYMNDEPAIVSPAYSVFEVDDGIVQPEYLMMWFRREHFDKEASYNAIGGVRGSLDWNSFMELRIPIIPREDQHMDVMYHDMYLRQKENKILTELQSLLLAKMGQ